jgi:hypothetical protein
MPRGSLFADARRFLCLCVVTVCPFTNSRMLPRPPLVPPEVECPANVAALYGPGIVLFGTAVVNALNCHAEGIEGVVTPKLSDTVAACGGASKWQGFVADCVAKLSKLPGSIAFNWISIDCTADGPSGACCLTCGGNSISFGGGRATSSPFNSYLQHTQSRKHEKARDALLAKVEAAAVASGLPRAEIAMQILAERAGLLPASELPHVELQPVGSEPLGPPTTRSIGWSAAQPNQPATKQEQLDEQLGTGAFTVNDDGKPVPFTDPMLYLDAIAANVMVICNWYRRDSKARGYTFTYDDEAHSTAYPLSNALGLVALALPRRDRYDLLDQSQGPRLDAALELTKPSKKPASKRTRGEEVAAEAAKHARQEYRPEDLGMRAPSGKARAPPTARVRS